MIVPVPELNGDIGSMHDTASSRLRPRCEKLPSAVSNSETEGPGAAGSPEKFALHTADEPGANGFTRTRSPLMNP